MNELQKLLERALEHHQAGRLADAQALYKEILAREPGQPGAQHFLGLLGCQIGQYDAGIALMEQSLAARREPAYLNNLGNVLREHGRLDDAIARYQEAVSLKADYAEAHNNLGNALREAKRAHEAMQSCARAIELKPDYAHAYNNLGNALQDLGELEAASKSYGKAIALAPDFARAHSNLGNVRLAQQQTDAAIDSYRRAVQLQPDLRAARQGLSAALRAKGDLAGALALADPMPPREELDQHMALARQLRAQRQFSVASAIYQKVLAVDPDNAHAHCELADVCGCLGAYDDAVSHARRAIELAPRDVAAYNILGNAYYSLEKFEAAELSHQYALEFDADNAQTYHYLAMVQVKQNKPGDALANCSKALSIAGKNAAMLLTLGDIRRQLNDVRGGIAAYREALTHGGDAMPVYIRMLFAMTSSPEFEPREWLDDARRFGELMRIRSQPFEHAPGSPRDKRPLRVGFVSGDLRSHPVGIFLESVIERIDRTRIEPVAYSTYAFEDDITRSLKASFSEWHGVHGMTTEEAARKIHADSIDVLVDLAGHTSWTGLPIFGFKPAPVQVSWLGFFATTGSTAIDYFLGDRHVLPETEEAHFVERPWRLPDSYLCFTPPREAVSVGPLPMLSNGHVTFGCFGKLVKVTDKVIAVWSRLMRALPGSRLFLKAPELKASDMCEATKARFAAHGIDEGRLILEGPSPRALYLDAYNRVDITLSPFPYGGGTTTAEGLWMGVPVLGMKGDRFVTHICESLLHTAGLGEWIAEDEEDYVRKALAYAGDPGKLNTLRAGLRAQVLNSPLCDAKRFARSLESAFEQMWSRYVAGADKTLEES
ncbi:tetratricopeptide repeat protein [Paraburkholderia phymatum]|uniref:tetratricopeptide repeat protein n=1 Tax=Paraburkholderia phymatum TaxID=148447 RepID=UPI00316EEA85